MLSQLAVMFSSIPFDVEQAALKIYSTGETLENDLDSKRRGLLHYVISVHGNDLDKLRLRFFYVGSGGEHTHSEDA